MRNPLEHDASDRRVAWRCEDSDCDHQFCTARIMWSDTGEVEIRGEIRRNPIDGLWDWSVRVDHYGTSSKKLHHVETELFKHAKAMASQVGRPFKGPKPKVKRLTAYDLDD
jgi:hypothetical protein